MIKSNIMLAVIGVLLFILWLDRCGNNKKIDNKPDTLSIINKVDTTFIYDTVVRNIKVPYYLPSKIITFEVPAKVDTQTILKDYYSKKYYYKSIRDSNIAISIIDSIYENEVKYKNVNYKLLRPDIVIRDTTVITIQGKLDKKFHLYLGAEVGGNVNQFNVSPILILQNKKDNLLSYRYGVIDKTHNIGIGIKIK